MKLFVKKIFLYILILTALIVCLNGVYMSHCSNFGTMGTQKNDSAYIQDVPSGIQICNFGDSHGYYGFNYEKYDEEYTCFNFSLSGQSMRYNYRILENYRDRIVSGAKVYICLSYQSFFGGGSNSDGNTEENKTVNEDFNSEDKRYYHFLKREYINNYNIKTDIFVNYLPVLAGDTRERIRTILGLNENLDWWADTTDQQSAIRHGEMRSINLINSTLDGVGKRVYCEGQIECLYDIIALCREIQADPVLVTIPYLSEYTSPILQKDPKLIEDYNNLISEVQQKTGVRYYDYSMDTRFADRYDLYFNTDHMNRNGAAMFTEILLNDTMNGQL